MDALWTHSPSELVFVEPGEEVPAHLTDRLVHRRPIGCPKPYPVRTASVDSICGFFASDFDLSRHQSVTFPGSSYFGSHKEMFHEAGCVYVYKTSLHFKGCHGLQGVARVCRSLMLPSCECRVHMGVFSANLGKRVHTGLGCYMENRVSELYKGIRVVCRMVDDNIVVRLRIADFLSDDLPQLPEAVRPSSADIIVSAMGSMLLRCSWKKILWDEEAEAAILGICEWLAARLRECC